MRALAAVEPNGGDTIEDNLRDLFESIIGLFENLADVSADWPEPWNWVFPAFLALILALAFVAGIRYVFEKMQEWVRPWLFVAVLVIGLATVAAVVARSQSTSSEGAPALEAD
jgi:hypothetical protein